MRAAFYEATGPAQSVLQLGDMPVLEPAAGEVRVRIAWSGVNPSDVKSRGGTRTKTLAFPRIVPHSDGSGVIDAVGAGVSCDRIGEPVWVWNAAWGRAFGTAAQYVVLPAAQAVRLPDGLDLVVGASLGIPALTAWYAVTVDGGVAGRSVLVAGGAGAVGHYAIQIARLLGASTIIATVSSDEKESLAKAAGADTTINYKTEDVVARVKDATQGAGVDRLIEVNFGVNVGIDHQLVAANGEIVVYGSDAMEIAVPFVPMILKNIGLRFFIVYNLSASARQQALSGLTAMLQAGRLTHNIATRLPLEQIATAHELVEQGKSVGNVVLSVA